MKAGNLMGFGILGSLQITAEGTSELIELPPKPRILMARLLLSANRIVPFPALIDALWDGPPPRTARLTTQGYIKHLRQALHDSGKARIVTADPGYRVVVAKGELDLAVFGLLREEAVAAAGARDWATAARKLHAALRLWRGSPLLDIPSGQLQREEVPALTETWLQALELRVDADLRLGRYGQLIPELRKLTCSYPLREKLHGQLMTAQYLSGRQAEALDSYQRVRELLGEELGIMPSRELRELHRHMLAGEPVPADSAAANNGHRTGQVRSPRITCRPHGGP